MAEEEDISGLLHKCSLNMEEEDEVEITEEHKGDRILQCRQSLLGRIATFRLSTEED
ncbi:hypothetical protein Scep_024524 [Stephania cephalantha]|uniref:Uncharacterized protein n=1 Tax=Stephania cephalantha TaxID=152367 RepID=A0AAP0F5P5_9MAGN